MNWYFAVHGNNRKYIRGYLILLVYITRYIAEKNVEVDESVKNNLITMIVSLVGCFTEKNYEKIINDNFLNKISSILKKLVIYIKQILLTTHKGWLILNKMKDKFNYNNLSVFLLLFTDREVFYKRTQFLPIDWEKLTNSINKHDKFNKSTASKKIREVFDEFKKRNYQIGNRYKNKYIKYKKKYLKLKDNLKN